MHKSVKLYGYHTILLSVQVLSGMSKGAFEVTINHRGVHSRLKSGSYPDHEEILKCIKDAQDGKQLKAVH
ncbi:Hypothetical predicted protein [Octopus vulgaris]|uniref:Uncharacterized protein n=1 Tax=Octopus vulgaris TaxID=6645 RepID=A0AA36BKS3_OCTVU|nr:Hypothetical predicted protein [Octopus vulgaris]